MDRVSTKQHRKVHSNILVNHIACESCLNCSMKQDQIKLIFLWITSTISNCLLHGYQLSMTRGQCAEKVKDLVDEAVDDDSSNEDKNPRRIPVG